MGEVEVAVLFHRFLTIDKFLDKICRQSILNFCQSIPVTFITGNL